MAALRLLVDSYFDGSAHHPGRDGPYLLTIEGTRIASIDRHASDAPFEQRAAFAMPGLVEAHAHLFLDGGELDFDKRNAYLDAPKDEMLRVARENIVRNAAAGVTLVRDAGDRYGVNDAIRAEQRGGRVAVRSPGLGVKRPKRYGGFMARDIEAGSDVAPVVADMAATADDIKIILTGIITIYDLRVILDMEKILLALAVAGAFTLGIGTFNCYMFVAFQSYTQVWAILNRPMFIVSGIFFLFDDVPQPFRDILWFNPLVHIIGEMRSGIYATYEANYVSIAYVLGLAGLFFTAGLVLLRRHLRDAMNQ